MSSSGRRFAPSEASVLEVFSFMSEGSYEIFFMPSSVATRVLPSITDFQVTLSVD